MFTDTHTHLADTALYDDLSGVLQQARLSGVCRFIAPSASVSDWHSLESIQSTEIYCAFGIHPWYVAQADEDAFTKLEAQLGNHSRALVGEIGLDRSNKNPSPDAYILQEKAFVQQLQIAQKFDRPIILHNVRAGNALIRLIKANRFSRGGFAHAFSGSLEEAHEFIKLGFKIGIGSLLMNPSAKKVREAASHLPLDSIVLETDSPFMPKNSTGTPANIRKIAEITASLRGIPLETLAEQVEKNVNEILSFCT